MMIFNGTFGPEICVSPAEVNGNIKPNPYFQYSKPEAVDGVSREAHRRGQCLGSRIESGRVAKVIARELDDYHRHRQ